MKKSMKLLSVLLSSAIVITLSACGQTGGTATQTSSSAAVQNETSTQTQAQAKTPVNLKLLLQSADDARKAINSKYIQANFKTELPDYNVEVELGGGGTDYENKIKTYNAAGEMPDVFFVSGSAVVDPVIQAGNVLDLLPYITKDGTAAKYKIKAPIEPRQDGKLYALNPGSDNYFTPRIFYHKDIFAKYNIQVPKTFDEFMAASKTLKSNGIVPFTSMGKDGWCVINYLFQNIVMSINPQTITDLMNNKTNFEDPVCIQALNTIQKMAQQGVFPDGMAMLDYGPGKELFTSKKAAMYGMFTWDLPDLAKDPDVGMMNWPSIKDGVDRSNVIQLWGGPDSGYAVAAKSKNLDAAVKLAEYANEQDAKFFNIEQKAPTAYDTGIKLEGASDLMTQNLQNIDAAATKVNTLGNYAFGTKMLTEFGTNSAKLLTGKMSGEDFAKAIDKTWADNFKK
jgi:raffinose/stachyose/melibiose transport system substrate-binding protein